MAEPPQGLVGEAAKEPEAMVTALCREKCGRVATATAWSRFRNARKSGLLAKDCRRTVCKTPFRIPRKA